jgi:diaminohydroxyphosphoribosylaminopyrimidine deaminase/5-amino-6-(5-phosphoribosylamino)uracil reductase
VVLGVLEKEAREINKGFFKARKTCLPYVTLKLATSLDGKIALKNSTSKWITGEKAREFSHYLRAENDAILVGAHTVRRDNPMLDCRLFGLEGFSPKRIIISNNLDFDSSLKIFASAKEIPTAILTASKKAAPENVETIICAEKNGKIGLQEALEKLCHSGINSLLIEGGQTTATEFLKENLVDEIIWIRSNKIFGNDGISGIGDLGFEKISETLNNFTRSEVKELGEDLAEIFVKK